jgi:(5-formylfuran-3-yl)methyl phosphate synthase
VRLLVSVRSAAETAPALAGGADIIDAKDPSRGSLGAVASDELAAILASVPTNCPFSVALGDIATVEEAVHAISSMRLSRRRGPVFVKLGFAGIRSPAAIGRLLESAIAAATSHRSHPRIVAVAYADAEHAGSLPSHQMVDLAAAAGCTGVLLDTYRKDGRGVLRSLAMDALADWIASARSLGLLTALAGELRPADLAVVSALGPDIVGVRGAACDGGRCGVVNAERVRALRTGLAPATSRQMVV